MAEFFLLAVLCVVGTTATAVNALSSDGLVVNTRYGPVRGLSLTHNGNGYRRWQGIPFAEPPLGALRWKNPTAPTAWTAVKNCEKFDIGCAQRAHSLDVPKNTSEDCLYLEVWAPPAGKYKEPAAVLDFIYGGDFKEGGESFKIYDGRYVASTTNTILVVSNYRVGNLGFLFTPHTDTNVGLMDQRFTLQWIQDNIAAFGGDKDKVTVLGQSAGGQSVLFHLSSPASYTAKFFHGAICESGPLPLTFKHPDAGYLLAEIFGVHLGCPNIDDIACMQSKTTKEVLEAAGKSFVVPLDVGSAVQQWAPIIDGSKEFPQEPLFAFQRGELVQPPVPMMIGSNLNDGALFAYAIPDWPKKLPAWEYIAVVVGIVHDDWIDTVLKRYPANDTDSTAVLSHLMTDFFFACASRRTVRWAEHAHSGPFTQTYLYQMTQVPPFCFWPKHQEYCCHMCCHGDELAYWNHDTGAPFPWNMTGNVLELADQVSAYWTNFAHHGDPNAPAQGLPAHIAAALPKWPLYREASDMSQDFNEPLKPVQHLLKATCDMWDEVGYNHATRQQPASLSGDLLALNTHIERARSDPAIRAKVDAIIRKLKL